MPFEFATANRIVFGLGTLGQAGQLLRSYGTRTLVVTGGSVARAARLFDLLHAAGVAAVVLPVPHEPVLDTVRAGVSLIKEDVCESIAGFGGGSPIDAAKAIAIIATNSGEPLDYLEVVGKGKQFEHAPLPFVAIPTTAGTGAEVTRNAVLGSPQHQLKASLRSPAMLAKVAIVDPELTFDLPPSITAYSGCDALTQLIEPFVSSRANPFTDALCRQALPLIAAALPAAFHDGSNQAARESMSLASLFSGLALANAGLGVVHAFANPLGGTIGAPHGAICAAILPHAVEANIRALERDKSFPPALARYQEIARIVTKDSEARAQDLVGWLEQLGEDLAIRPLRELGLTPAAIPALIPKAAQATSMKANPLPLTDDELAEILERSL